MGMMRDVSLPKSGQRYVAMARPSTLTCVERLGPGPLSLAWIRPRWGVHAAGIGAAGHDMGPVDWFGRPPDDLIGPWFGGWAFSPRDAWEGYPDEQWTLPEVLAWGPPGAVRVAAFGPVGTTQAALEAHLDAVEETPPGPAPGCLRREAGDADGWCLQVQLALDAIATEEMEKIVLARRVHVQGERSFDPRRILPRLVETYPDAWTYLVTSPGGEVFLGASPETLCDVAEGVAVTEALAGTAAVGAEAALYGTKERLEHQLVVDAIVERLSPLAVRVEVEPCARVVAQGALRHLRTPIRAVLRTGTDPLAVARALHPTPAVAGSPEKVARAWIGRLEAAPRGWYAGAVGARGAERLSLGVAIRCARLSGNVATLFVGAGLVAGSDARAEWAETELKASVMLRALGDDDDG